MIKSYLKIAWRNLMKNKMYTIINVSGLSVGICFCTVIYLITSFQFSFNNFFQDKDRIYRVVSDLYSAENGPDHNSGIRDAAPLTMRSEITGLESVAVFHSLFVKAAVKESNMEHREFEAPDERNRKSDIIIADPGYFTVFNYNWLAGNKTTALKEPFAVVLTESKAHRYFGKKEAGEMLGKIIIYDDSLQVTVTGVVADLPDNTDFRFNDFISFSTIQHGYRKNIFHFNEWSDDRNTQTWVKLSPATTYSQIDKQLAGLVNRHITLKAGAKEVYRLQSLSDIHFNHDYDDNYSTKAHRPTMYGLMIIALFILILAVINFINLSTVVSATRAKEIGIRKVCGSRRMSLAIQFLGETLIVTLLAVVISFAGLQWLLNAFGYLMPDAAHLPVFSPSTGIFLLLIAVFTALLAGFYPAKILSSYMPAQVLKGGIKQSGKEKGYLRKGLIIFQFTISLVLIIGAIVVRDQLSFMLNKDLGFSKDAVMVLKTDLQQPYAKKDLLADRIRQLSGVKMVSVSDGTPLATEHWANPLTYKGEYEKGTACNLEWADEHFIPFYDIKIIAGRNIMNSDTAKELLINEACAKALGFNNPEEAINKYAETMVPFVGFKSFPIVGVIRDFHSESLHKVIAPLFIASSAEFTRTINIKLNTNGRSVESLKKNIADIEAIWTEIYPNNKFEYSFLDNIIADLYQREQKTAGLINIAMTVAIFIACIGLLGLAAFTTQQRAKEISIRKVLGAGTGSIVVMLSKDTLLLVILSVVVATPIGWYFMHTWLQDFVYRIHLSFSIFLLSGIIAIATALATVSLQVIKAALANPAKNMRSE